MRASAIALLVAATTIAACHRRAEEPAPQASPSTSNSTSTPTSTPAPTANPALDRALAGRCIVPTPDAPPRPIPPPASQCPHDPDPHTLALSSVDFPDAKNGGHLVVELARTMDENERGLMYRTSMAEDHGMWFDDGEHKVHTFWMHNTCIPLDLLFLDEDGLVVGIVENAPTLDDGIQAVACPSSYVLEVNAGWVRRHGVRAGQRAIIPPRA